MEKIDRLGWAAGLSIYAYGLRIGIRVNQPEILEHLPERLPPGWEPSCSPFVDQLYSLRIGGAGPRPNVRNYSLLYAGLTRLARTMDTDEVLDILENDLQLHVAEWARNRVFVHAGVVGWQGRAIMIPGRTFSGKSTLVAALLRAGATYYSDEYAVLDARGYVHPYARPLSLRQPAGVRPKRFPPEALGSRPAIEPLPVGLVAVTQYQQGARWRPRPLSPGKAVLALLNNTVPVQRQPDMALTTLQQVVPHARSLKGVRGEASDMAEALLQDVGI